MKNKVLVGGFFDLYHLGHLRMFQKAKEQGDYLVVYVASDKETKEIKGDTRPVIPGKERAELLRSVSCIDEVLYSEEFVEMETIIDLVNPSVYILNKGSKAREEKLCKERGIKVVKLGRSIPPSGLDTTKIIKKVKGDVIDGINYILVNKEGKILLQKRDNRKGIRCPGEWCIPGGRVDKGENPEETLLREVKEETGLKIMFYDGVLCDLTYPWNEKNRFFIVGVEDVKVKSTEGKMVWKTLEQVKKLKLAANQADVIPLLEKYVQEI